MEEIKAEKETAIAAVTLKAKVLSIGEDDTCPKPTQTENYDMANFHQDFRSYMNLLLFGTRVPVEVKQNWHLMDMFEMKMIEKDNQPRRCRFYCHRGGNYENYHCMCNGNTVNAEIILHEMHKRLKAENWKTKYELELPLKAEIGNKQNDSEEYYIGSNVNDAMYETDKKIFQLFHQLHKEYVREQTLRFG